MGVVCAVEGVKVVQMGIPPVSFQVLEGSQAGAFTQELVGGPGVEGFVVGLRGRRGRIRLRVRARHGVNKELKKEERKKGLASVAMARRGKSPKKCHPREKNRRKKKRWRDAVIRE